MKINQIVFDMEAMEYVKITNGIPVQGTPDVTPTEAVALRVVGVCKKKIISLLIYRRVNANQLRVSYENTDWFNQVLETL